MEETGTVQGQGYLRERRNHPSQEQEDQMIILPPYLFYTFFFNVHYVMVSLVLYLCAV